MLIVNLPAPVSVEKFKVGEKYVLKLSTNSDTSYISYSGGEALKPFTYLGHNDKIDLIGKLLSLEGDTSTCHHKVVCFWPQYYRGNYPKAEKYELQVEALHMINFLAFTDISYAYSPFPVLYDTTTKKEITGQSPALKGIYILYKKWFEKIKMAGFYAYGYPLAGSKYKWFGGKNKAIIFSEYPGWRKDAAGDSQGL